MSLADWPADDLNDDDYDEQGEFADTEDGARQLITDAAEALRRERRAADRAMQRERRAADTLATRKRESLRFTE